MRVGGMWIGIRGQGGGHETVKIQGSMPIHTRPSPPLNPPRGGPAGTMLRQDGTPRGQRRPVMS